MTLGIDVDHSQWAEPFLEVVFNCGLNIAEKHKAEVLVKTASEITEEDLAGGQKIIALEKTSGGNIAFRHILKHPSVIRYIKSFNYNHFQLHNQPCVDKRLFTTLLPHNVKLESPGQLITQNDYNKISLGWSILHYFRLREILSLETEDILQSDHHRPIDVFFAGSLDYDNRGGLRPSGDIISDHRKKCVEVLESIKGCEKLIVKGKHLGLDAYNQIICNSKVVVSPWGWGEPCYRDFEAILAGCTLIKPVTNFVKSACGIFENSHCTWTTPDFSNLGNDIAMALRDFKKKQTERINSREMIIKAVKVLPQLAKANLTV